MLRHVLDDKGYVRLVTYMPWNMVGLEEAIERGDLDAARRLIRDHDLTPVNAARASYAKASTELTERDRRLIHFLAGHGHTSPFRHSVVQFEINAPLMVARQHWRYVVGSAHQEGAPCTLTAWNESSRRYVTEDPTFYVPKPDEWRAAPENKKQGSGGLVSFEMGRQAWERLVAHVDMSLEHYDWALDAGICAEQARLFLPAYGLYVKYYWTASVQAICHFLNQRLAHEAQAEIQAYAAAVWHLVEPKFPESVRQLVGPADLMAG